MRLILFTAAALVLEVAAAIAQDPATAKESQAALVLRGQIVMGGHATSYLVRHLPPSSFAALPRAVEDELNKRGCMIPQTYEAHRPENVVHTNFEGLGGEDWAMLCAAKGTVSLLVFFDGNLRPAVLASAPETERLQAHDSSGVLGFNWAIDPASPKQVEEAQAGMYPRPAVLDHDALADTILDHRTVYHFYVKGAWTLVKLPE